MKRGDEKMNEPKSYEQINTVIVGERLLLAVMMIGILFCFVRWSVVTDEMAQIDEKRINCDYAFEIRDVELLDEFCFDSQDY